MPPVAATMVSFMECSLAGLRTYENNIIRDTYLFASPPRRGADWAPGGRACIVRALGLALVRAQRHAQPQLDQCPTRARTQGQEPSRRPGRAGEPAAALATSQSVLLGRAQQISLMFTDKGVELSRM
jgi:hypothetical protein